MAENGLVAWEKYRKSAIAAVRTTEPEQLNVPEGSRTGVVDAAPRPGRAKQLRMRLFNRLAGGDTVAARPIPDVSWQERITRADIRLIPCAATIWASSIVFAEQRIAQIQWIVLCSVLLSLLLLLIHVKLRVRQTGWLLTSSLLVQFLLPIFFGIVAAGVSSGFQLVGNNHSPLHQTLSLGGQQRAALELRSNPKAIQVNSGKPLIVFDAVVTRIDMPSQSPKGSVVFPTELSEQSTRVVVGGIQVRVIATESWKGLKALDHVEATFSVRSSKISGPVNFELRSLTAPLSRFTPEPSVVQRLGHQWIESAQKTWGEFDQNTAGLLVGMVQGDRSGISEDLKAEMKIASLTHLTAVSGANCSLVMASLMLILRTFHLRRGLVLIASLTGLLAFVAIVGLDASVLRAAVMGAIGTLSVLSGRSKSVGVLLPLAVILLLLSEPQLATDFAFILSVSATAGIHLLGSDLASWLSKYFSRSLAKLLAIPLAAQLFCSPVVVLLQPQILPYAVPANVVVVPVIALVTTVGTLGLAVGLVFPGIAQLCAWIAGAGSWWVGLVARFIAGLPGVALPWPEGARGVALMILLNVLLILGIYLLRRGLDRGSYARVIFICMSLTVVVTIGTFAQ